MPAKQINEYGLDPDRAISDEKDDLLGRHPLAYRIADMINNFGDDYKDSIVIGIEGEWGSGKSSFINLMLNKVRPEKKNLVIEFNPWNFSDQNELIKDFFDSVAEGVNKALAKKVKDYALKLLAHTDLEPSLSFLGCTVRLGRWKFRHSSEKPLKRQRDDIVHSFSELEKRIVIVIDDIDRLDSDETKLIFKLVRLIADFPNTVFILAYDRDKVGKRMDEWGVKGGIKGEEYLRKIIQLPFLMPKPALAIYGELTKTIRAELKHRGFQEIDEERLLELISSQAFRGLFPTIRDIRRYTNSLRLDLKMLNPEELNPVDFVGIEAIRVFAPEIYLAMTNEKNAFTVARPIPPMTVESERTQIKAGIERSIGEAPDSIKEIVHLLFPQAKGLDSELGYAPQSQNESRYTREKRVCSKYMFDKYFSLSVPSMYISEKEIQEFVSETDARVLLEKLKGFSDQGKLRLASERLVDEWEKLSDQQQENLLISLLDSAEYLKYDEQEDPGGINEFVNLAWRAVYDTLRGKIEGAKIEFLTRLMNATKGFFTLTLFFDYLNEEIERSKMGTGEKPLLTEDELMLARKAYAKKIKTAAKSGSLMDSKKCGFTLIFWEWWGEKGEAKNYITELLETDEGILALLKGFVEEEVEMPVREVSEGKIPKLDQFSRFNRIHKKKIGTLADLADLDKRVDKIDINELSEEDLEAIELYKNPRKIAGMVRGEQHHFPLR